MNERQPNTPIEIPRRSPSIKMRLGEHAVDLTWYNTLIQAYKSPYQAMSHLEVTIDDGRRLSAFSSDGGDDRNFLELMKHGYPVRLDPEPTDRIAEMYTQWQTDGLTQELAEHLGDER